MATVVEELVATLGLEVDQASFKKADAAVSGVKRGLASLGNSLLAGLGIGAGMDVFGLVKRGLQQMLVGTANAADAAGKLAQRTGLDSEALQRLAYAADLADISSEKLGVGLQMLAKKGVKDVSARVLEIADAFDALPNDGSRIKLLTDNFGKAGAQLATLFANGREALEADMAEAEVFGPEQIKAATDFNDNLTRLGKQFGYLRNLIGNAMIPVLDKLVKSSIRGIKAFREWVVALKKFLPSVTTLNTILKTTAIIIGSVLLAALLANIGAIITAIGWYAALGIASVIAAAKAVAAWLATIAPFVLLAAAIAVVILFLEDLYVFLSGGDSLIGRFAKNVEKNFGGWRGFFGALWSWIVDLFLQGTNAIAGFMRDLGKKLGDIPIIGKLLKGGFEIGASITQGGVGDLAGGLYGDAKVALNGMFGSGATSPRAAAVNAPGTTPVNVSAPQVSATFNVTASPGMSPEDVAGAANQQFTDWWGAEMRKADAGVE